MSDLTQLLAHVLQDPTDDFRRQVLADKCEESAHPRASLIRRGAVVSCGGKRLASNLARAVSEIITHPHRPEWRYKRRKAYQDLAFDLCYLLDHQPCPICRGSGFLFLVTCRTCDGNGVLPDDPGLFNPWIYLQSTRFAADRP